MLSMVKAPTPAPLIPVPLFAVIFKPRTVFPELRTRFASVGRDAGAMERFGVIVNPTP
jgi:hypothetical protein